MSSAGSAINCSVRVLCLVYKARLGSSVFDPLADYLAVFCPEVHLARLEGTGVETAELARHFAGASSKGHASIAQRTAHQSLHKSSRPRHDFELPHALEECCLVHFDGEGRVLEQICRVYSRDGRASGRIFGSRGRLG